MSSFDHPIDPPSRAILQESYSRSRENYSPFLRSPYEPSGRCLLRIFNGIVYNGVKIINSRQLDDTRDVEGAILFFLSRLLFYPFFFFLFFFLEMMKRNQPLRGVARSWI